MNKEKRYLEIKDVGGNTSAYCEVNEDFNPKAGWLLENYISLPDNYDIDWVETEFVEPNKDLPIIPITQEIQEEVMRKYNKYFLEKEIKKNELGLVHRLKLVKVIYVYSNGMRKYIRGKNLENYESNKRNAFAMSFAHGQKFKPVKWKIEKNARNKPSKSIL